VEPADDLAGLWIADEHGERAKRDRECEQEVQLASVARIALGKRRQ
jgi:hypothetical protein